MKSKEEYYAQVLRNRELAADPAVTRCPCPHTLCEWHGRCRECVALHRFHKDHVPVCLQPVIEDKIRALAGAAEMTAVKKEGTPLSYRLYVKEQDKTRRGE